LLDFMECDALKEQRRSPTMSRSVEGDQKKVQSEHLQRAAYVYVRQSSPKQVLKHGESRRRQYQLADWAFDMGWPRERIVVVDEDQGKSSAAPNTREGFARLISAVGRGEVGMVIALEVSRLARNSPDWHHLVYMSRWTNTLIADEQTVYDPNLPADRMVLGIRNQMSEMELDNAIGRMIKARWNKAKRGELLTIPPAGYEIDDLGQLVITSDESVAQAIRTVFTKFDELGSGRQVFIWWQKQGLRFPVRRLELRSKPVVWVEPVYRMILQTLRNPIYAGIYAFGKTRTVRELDPETPQKLRIRREQVREWPVLIRDHHAGYIPFKKWLEIQKRMQANSMMSGGRSKQEKMGAIREGPALLQGLVRCGVCSRRMIVSYGGHRSAQGQGRVYQYRCVLARNQRGGKDCQTIGSKRIDQSVVEAFLEATQPAALDAARLANEEAKRQREALHDSWKYQIEKAEYESERAARQYHAVEPENRLVARQLEQRWNDRLKELEQVRVQAQEALRGQPLLSEEELAKVRILSADLEEVWEATTTENRDRKRLLQCLIEEVQLRTEQKHYQVRIVWKGGVVTDRKVLRIKAGKGHATCEDTVELVRRLAKEFDDAQIARILNRQGRRTGLGNTFTLAKVLSLRGHHKIPKCPNKVAQDPREGPFTADEAAAELGVTMTTIHRWLRTGVLAGEQATPGAPWRIVLSDQVRKRLGLGEAPEGWVGLTEAARRLGLSKSNVAYLVRTGKIEAVRTTVRNRPCWRINVSSTTCGKQQDLLDQMTNDNTGEA
jgi:DNA invertase Pin-like site-specific DNA recombinase